MLMRRCASLAASCCHALFTLHAKRRIPVMSLEASIPTQIGHVLSNYELSYGSRVFVGGLRRIVVDFAYRFS
jgi:hypothetical protein